MLEVTRVGAFDGSGASECRDGETRTGRVRGEDRLQHEIQRIRVGRTVTRDVRVSWLTGRPTSSPLSTLTSVQCRRSPPAHLGPESVANETQANFISMKVKSPDVTAGWREGAELTPDRLDTGEARSSQGSGLLSTQRRQVIVPVEMSSGWREDIATERTDRGQGF
ncbi:hypothetical protein GSI_10252 [Ganoderma sinense ZZ0214-1]|uniref:Uncharacterized protein n=1 Tax=Ganoderma sinense ZZ0214-1 TaxID=1077348 RepID=A0A2G8S017_9APHY|nr:hypothetical protein GSI_10252 [Ganoderma sinense ZZ0214-1]